MDGYQESATLPAITVTTAFQKLTDTGSGYYGVYSVTAPSFAVGRAGNPVRYQLRLQFHGWPTASRTGSPSDHMVNATFFGTAGNGGGETSYAPLHVWDPLYLAGTEIPQYTVTDAGPFHNHQYVRSELPSTIPDPFPMTFDLDFPNTLANSGGPIVSLTTPTWAAGSTPAVLTGVMVPYEPVPYVKPDPSQLLSVQLGDDSYIGQYAQVSFELWCNNGRSTKHNKLVRIWTPRPALNFLLDGKHANEYRVTIHDGTPLNATQIANNIHVQQRRNPRAPQWVGVSFLMALDGSPLTPDDDGDPYVVAFTGTGETIPDVGSGYGSDGQRSDLIFGDPPATRPGGTSYIGSAIRNLDVQLIPLQQIQSQLRSIASSFGR